MRSSVKTPSAFCILPAAGSGRRFGGPKQYRLLAGEPLLIHAARAALASASIDRIVVAAPADDLAKVEALFAEAGLAAALHAVVPGGAERADSVRAALDALPSSAEYVAIHDAARPFASPALFDAVLAAAAEQGAALAALPCTDTVKRSTDGATAKETVDRRELWLAQTPQAFRVTLLRQAYAAAEERASLATDEAALVEALGETVALVPGEKENFKVTDPEDWERAEARVGAPTVVGFGYDVHAYAEGRRCILGGIEFPGEVGLAGHSDADAALHAISDALLGAAGLGDIGQLFPDTDPALEGADSGELLAEVVRRVEARGFRVGNVDLTIAAQRPKIGPRREEMRRRIAGLLRIPVDRVNVKATTTEGLGFVGRAEGVACQAVALLHRR